MRLPFASEAAEELEATGAWYESERPGYGALFVDEVRKAVELAAIFPLSGHSVAGAPEGREVRRFALRSFPYSVVTAVLQGKRAVIAVAHHRRAPDYWLDRSE